MVKRLVGIGDYLIENLTLRRNSSAARLVNQRGDIHVFVKADFEETVFNTAALNGYRLGGGLGSLFNAEHFEALGGNILGKEDEPSVICLIPGQLCAVVVKYAEILIGGHVGYDHITPLRTVGVEDDERIAVCGDGAGDFLSCFAHKLMTLFEKLVILLL